MAENGSKKSFKAKKKEFQERWEKRGEKRAKPN
jgi:hypothetical protein